MNLAAPLSFALSRLPGVSTGERLDLEGRIALVTGGAAGIGLGVAHELHARGARVVIADLVTLSGSPFDSRVADVTDRAAMADLVASVVQDHGSLDVVVANAGVSPVPATLRTMDPADYDRVVAINQTGVFNTVHPAIEPVIAAGGHIVVVASVAAFMPGPCGSPYMITKAAVEQLGRALRLELAPHGASAGVAAFGVVETAMTTAMLDDDPIGSALTDQLPGPLRRRITAQEAAVSLVDGIERRAARTLAPESWTALSLLRGVAGVAIDARAARDERAHDVVRQTEARVRG